MDHAPLSASGSATWLNCPGSVAAQADPELPPEVSSPFAQEGTVAHKLADLCLTATYPAEHYLGEFICADEGITDICVDEEMVNYIKAYVEYVDGLGRHQFPETRVDFSPWTIPGQFGTSDNITIDDKVMHVVDLKYGKGVQVFAENNTQAMLYGLGSHNDFGWMFPKVTKIQMHIYQPRINHYDDWQITLKKLLEWGNDVAKPAAEATMESDAPRIPGEKQCLWCKARPICPEAAQHNLAIAMEEFTDIGDHGDLIDTNLLTLADIAKILPNVDGIISWAKSVESHAVDSLKEGKSVPGYKLVEGRSNRVYNDEEQALIWVDAKIGDDSFNPPTPRARKTLAQIDKLCTKGQKVEFKTFHKKAPGKPALAVESDPRTAFNSQEAGTQSAMADFEDL